LELQLRKNKLNSAAANNSSTQQSVVPETTDISELSEIICVLVGNVCTGKTTIFESYKRRNLYRQTEVTICAGFNTAEQIVDGVCFKLNIWDSAGNEKYEDFVLSNICNVADVFLICFRAYDLPSERDKASYWIPVVRQRYPKTPIVLVDTTTMWNTTNNLTLTSDVEDGMLLAEQNNAVTYIKCSCNVDDINAVFVTAVRATEKAKQLKAALANTPQPALDQRPRSKLDKFKLFFTGRRPDNH
jgi:small GTP-binding protein